MVVMLVWREGLRWIIVGLEGSKAWGVMKGC